VPPGTPRPEEVREQLGRILAHHTFVRSKSLSKLLQTIVTQTSDNQPGALKEVALASLLHADKDYNPSEHSNIRVEVSNLRKKLDRYYASDGVRDAVLICIPRGSYVASFQYKTAERRRPDRKKFVLKALALAGSVTLLAVLAGLLWRNAPTPRFKQPVQLTFGDGYTAEPSISSDGDTMVYASDRGEDRRVHIWIQSGKSPPRQLTDGPGHDFLPELSPDKRFVAFRSLGNGESLRMVPANGGASTLIAKGAYSPRFSPDGRLLAYSTLNGDSAAHVYVVDPVQSGQPRRVDSGVPEALCPIWAPDGRHIIFLARDDAQKSDYWIAPVPANGAPAKRLGIQALLQRANLPLLESPYDCPQDWIGNSLLFRVDNNDPRTAITTAMTIGNAFRVLLTPPEWEPGSSVEILEPRLRTESLRVAIDRHSIVFSAEEKTKSVWSLSLDAPNAPVFLRVMQDESIRSGFEGTWPGLSADGNTVCFAVERTGKPDIFCKNLKSMTEQVLGSQPIPNSLALPDADGRRVAYLRSANGRSDLVVREVSGGAERLITSECPVLVQAAADQSWFLCSEKLGQPGQLLRVAASTGGSERLMNFKQPVMSAQLSPDTQWLAFVVDENRDGVLGGYVVSLRGSSDDPSNWIKVAEERFYLSLHWGPDGDSLYFWQIRDGSRCLWGQHLDSLTKRPSGTPFPVLHRHSYQAYPIVGGTLAIAGSAEHLRLAMTLSDRLSNIWRVSLP
jgi:Tol biopolymer transport system component